MTSVNQTKEKYLIRYVGTNYFVQWAAVASFDSSDSQKVSGTLDFWEAMSFPSWNDAENYILDKLLPSCIFETVTVTYTLHIK